MAYCVHTSLLAGRLNQELGAVLASNPVRWLAPSSPGCAGGRIASYRLKKNGAEAHIDMKFEPESPYVDKVMDVRVFLKWVPVEGGGYWEYAHAKGFEEVLR